MLTFTPLEGMSAVVLQFMPFVPGDGTGCRVLMGTS